MIQIRDLQNRVLDWSSKVPPKMTHMTVTKTIHKHILICHLYGYCLVKFRQLKLVGKGKHKGGDISVCDGLFIDILKAFDIMDH